MSSKVEQSHTGSETFGAGEENKLYITSAGSGLTVWLPDLIAVFIKRGKLGLKGRGGNNQTRRRLENDTGVGSSTWYRPHG
jgi:hypothetical protein